MKTNSSIQEWFDDIVEASENDLFYIEIPGVPVPFIPDEGLLGKSRFQILEQYKIDSAKVTIIDDSNTINKIAYGLKDGRPNYSSLMNYGLNQTLLEEGKISEEELRGTFVNIDRILWQKGCIWAELLDCLPQKRGYQLEGDHDVALHRHASMTPDGVDLSRARSISLSLPKEAGRITEEWRGVLGATADTVHYPANITYSNKYLDGLSFLVWDFRKHSSPALDSGTGPNDWFIDRVTLLGSRASPQELISSIKQKKGKVV